MGEERVEGVSRGRTVRKMEGSREGCLIQGTAAKAVERKRIVPQNFPDFAAAQTSNLLHILLWPDKVFKMGVKKKRNHTSSVFVYLSLYNRVTIQQCGSSGLNFTQR